MKTLITGSEGFIGKVLQKRLLDTERLDLTLGHDLLKKTPDLYGIERIAHLAKLHTDKHIEADVNLLNEAVKRGIKRFVFASSAAVYGNHDEPVDEESNIDAINSYGIAKYFTERLLRMYHDKHGLETISLRFFNVYGNSDSEGVVDRMLKGKITVFGSGRNIRDYVHVDDVVTSIILALNTKKGFGEEYNIGTGKGYSVNELANIIKPEVTRVPGLLEINYSVAINKKARKIGWKPLIKLEDYLNAPR